MPSTTRGTYTCARCLRAVAGRNVPSRPPASQLLRPHFSTYSPRQTSPPSPARNESENQSSLEAQILNPSNKKKFSEDEQGKEPGAMSRRLADATEEALYTGGRAGRKAVEEAGFSEELKQKLLEKIESQKFRSDNAAAFAEAGLSPAAGRGTRDIAAAPAWEGIESTGDVVLRMLDDAHKPLKPGLRGPNKTVKAANVDPRIKRAPMQTSGQRLANARDKTSIYADLKNSDMDEKQREEMRRELKERFTPGARAMPNSITGLAALANERIENAIARGQFKNIPRGVGVKRDERADNPFIDTTEYIMNKMIKRQEIVPPWIEKQQELVKTARIFRARLRNEWKRHAARTIASRGGSLSEQMRTAERYALAEARFNPPKRAVEQISVPTNVTDDPVMVKITQDPATAPTASSKSGTTPEAAPSTPTTKVTIENKEFEITVTSPGKPADSPSSNASEAPTQEAMPLPPPFRDPVWEAAEHSYMTLAIANLNSLTRSYNLMAPDLAKKPYFNLARELQSCYAEVAPQVANEIKERAQRPARDLVEKVGHREGGLLEKFGTSDRVKVWDSRRSRYGFKEFWRDLWAKEGS